jgi:hypothetical protein
MTHNAAHAKSKNRDRARWVLVPRIPTEKMLETAYYAALAEDAAEVWKEMIEAAPPLPK